jgi:hypothetical protein
MRFQIEATTPTKADDLKATLEHARDSWRDRTPQEHAADSTEATELQNAQDAVDQARNEHKGGPAPNTLSRLVEAHAKLVKAQAAKPSADLTGCLSLIDDGIAMACIRAKSCKAPVRVSITGHFHTTANPLKGMQGNHERLTVNVDDATYG